MKRNKMLYAFAAALLMLALCLTACGPDSPASSAPEATPEPTPEATPEPTPEATPEVTPEATPEPPVVTPPATTSNPASDTDIIYHQTRPSTDTDIPED